MRFASRHAACVSLPIPAMSNSPGWLPMWPEKRSFPEPEARLICPANFPVNTLFEAFVSEVQLPAEILTLTAKSPAASHNRLLRFDVCERAQCISVLVAPLQAQISLLLRFFYVVNTCQARTLKNQSTVPGNPNFRDELNTGVVTRKNKKPRHLGGVLRICVLDSRK